MKRTSFYASVFFSWLILVVAVHADETKIKSVLETQVECWNRQELDGFMQTYWKSEDLTFSSGGKTTRGWQATFDRYKQRYQPPNKMGKLSFDNLEITMLNSTSAFVLGQWHLEFPSNQVGGNFTLILREIDGQWRIVHDHTSALPEQK